MKNNKVTVFWFRRDLRLEDNIGLYQALQSDLPVLPIFIFDSTILDNLESKEDRRVDYIHQALTAINAKLHTVNSTIETYYGTPDAVFEQLSLDYSIAAVYCNRDYEPQAIQRDKEIAQLLQKKGVTFKSFKDQVIFDHKDVLKNDGTPYTVYTPYSKRWKENLRLEDYRTVDYPLTSFYQQAPREILTLAALGFQKTDIKFNKPTLEAAIIDSYDKYRDYPSMARTTQLSIALRFGTISVRKCVEFALQHNETWLNELIWREFFMQILYFYPTVVYASFKSKYDLINWRNDEHEFVKWCNGQTGYPLVDAGMRQLNQTGFMHNRVRMVVASFLCKHLLIDWRWGEAYFAKVLNDYDLSANNGNWQWAAGSGCDAAPYFRVFNPTLQTERFDKNLEYIKKWIPEYGTDQYPKPMVDHSLARDRALRVYKEAVNENI